MGQLEGETAVVTGGRTGIGLATAARLASEGTHVLITGRRKDARFGHVHCRALATGAGVPFVRA